MYTTKILLDSVNVDTGDRITTWELTYPRFVHAELMTHRVFSRNAASSRAIPIQKMIAAIINDPVIPKWWGANQAGMQAKAELQGWRLKAAQFIWLQARWFAIAAAWLLWKAGLHKQIANRLLEPWMFITIILTATEYDNWFKLRCHPDAQPEIKWLADDMRQKLCKSDPKKLRRGQWHIPMVTDDEAGSLKTNYLLKIATGRLARVSYLTHDGKRDTQEDVKLHDRLLESGHWSPFEHCACASRFPKFVGNFRGFVQYRKSFQQESGSEKVIEFRKEMKNV